MKKVLFSILLVFSLSGCYNYKELNDYAIATGMAIDFKDNDYIVSLLIADTNAADSNDSNQTNVYSGKGNSIYEAIKNINLISSKEIYMGHISMVIISEETAKKGIFNTLEMLLNTIQSNQKFYITLAKKFDAMEILKKTDSLTNYSSTVHNNIKTDDNLQGSITAVDFNTLLKKLINNGTNPVLSGITIENNKRLSNNYIKVDSLGYFKKDKLIGWASKEESKGINLINNNVDQLIINLPCNNGDTIVNTDKFNNSINLINHKTVEISINGIGHINEDTCNINNQQYIKNIKKETNDRINRYVSKAINLSKNNGIDLFDIGQKYYQIYPQKYNKIKDWNKFFESINFKVNINIQIDNHASTNAIERISNEKNY